MGLCCVVFLQGVTDIFPYLQTVTDAVTSLNATVLALPDSISDIVNLVGELNNTLAPTIDKLRASKGEVVREEDMLAQLNLDILIQQTNTLAVPSG